MFLVRVSRLATHNRSDRNRRLFSFILTAKSTPIFATASWRRRALGAVVLLSLLPGVGSAMSQPTPTPGTATPTPGTATPTPGTPTPTLAPCSCVPDKLFPGRNLAKLRDVATGGKASKVPESITVRLAAGDTTPGSCTPGSNSDPVTVSLFLEDDDGDVILDRSKPGFVCSAGEKTYAKFTAFFEGPKNCKNSAVPATQTSQGNISAVMTTDDGALTATRKILCAATLPVVFTFTPPGHYHVTEGDTLNFTVTATRKNVPKTVTVDPGSLPPGATLDGTNFSWVGQFADTNDMGRHDVTFMADGVPIEVSIGTTELAIVSFDLVDVTTGVPLTGPIPIPIGGRIRVGAQALFDNPFGPPSPVGGQGTNAWANFLWSIDDTTIADFFSTTNVAVIDGLGIGMTPTEVHFTDATLGMVSATGTLDVLEVTSIAVDPPNLSYPEGSTERFVATATLSDGSQTQSIDFGWSTSNASVATVTSGSLAQGTAHIANVTGQIQGAATITASTVIGPLVGGTTAVTLTPALRNQQLFGLDHQPSGNRLVSIDTVGGSQSLATLLAPYDDLFCSSDSHPTNQLLVGAFDLSNGFSEIQRIDSLGTVTAEFTSDTTTPQGDTIDVQAIRYRPDGVAYFAMSEGADALDSLDAAGSTTRIGGPLGNNGVGPTTIAPDGNNVVYSAPWTFELTHLGNVVGIANLVARFDDGTNSNDAIAVVGVSRPQLAAPGGELWILDGDTGELFRFDDLNSDGDHYFIQGTTIQTAEDDPGERIPAGQLPSGFDTLHLDSQTGDMITTRVVGTAPQHITVMRLVDLNSDGDIDDAGEQTVVFDAGAPPGTDIVDVLLEY